MQAAAERDAGLLPSWRAHAVPAVVGQWGGGAPFKRRMQKPLSTGSSRAVVEEHVHVAAARRRRTSRRAPARHVVLGHLHMQRWRTVRSRRTGELVRVQRADTRAVCEHAEAGTPARGDHVNSDVVQSVLHVSSVCQTRRALLSCARQDRPLTSGTGYVMCWECASVCTVPTRGADRARAHCSAERRRLAREPAI